MALVWMESALEDPPPVLLIPISAPEVATAYLIQSNDAVPKKFPLIVMVVVIAPEFNIPVTAVTVPEVAMPLIVFPVIVSVAPVDELRIPIIAEVAPVEDVNTPALDRFPESSVYPVRILSTTVFPILLFVMEKTPAAPATSIPVNPPVRVAEVPTASIPPMLLFWMEMVLTDVEYMPTAVPPVAEHAV